MVQATKQMQLYSLDQLQLSDKELETKFNMLAEILAFGFKMPVNIYGSLFLALETILTKKLDLSKDFLILKLYKCLALLSEAQNAQECLIKHEHAVFEIVKFVLSLIKGNNASTTPEVQAESLKIIGKILLHMTDAKVIEIMPGVSSVATKVLSGEIKASSKIKIEFINIWFNIILLKYVNSLPKDQKIA